VTRRIAIVLAAALLAAVACRKTKPLSQNLNVENKVAVRPIVVYYEAPTLLLTGEQRNVPLPENPAAAMSLVVRELIKGSTNPSLPRLFPADTVVRGAFLLPDGTAFVDLGGPTLTAGWGTGTHQELMAVYSVVQTVVANFPQAKKVRILVDGEPSETLAGHISLAHALIPMPSLNADGPPLAAPPSSQQPSRPAAPAPAVTTTTAGTPHPTAGALNEHSVRFL
jgi:spore germination protein GerM